MKPPVGVLWVRALALLLAMTPGVAQADAKAGEKKAQLCLLCHKPDNQVAWVPLLERQTREYLYNQIKAYKERRRPDPVMQTNASSLSERDIRDIVDFFASRSPVKVSYPLDAAKLARGKLKAEALKCASCHMLLRQEGDPAPRRARPALRRAPDRRVCRWAAAPSCRAGDARVYRGGRGGPCAVLRAA